MPWQSDVLALVQFVFAVALVPTVANPAARVARRTSVTTAAGLWAVAFVYATLHLWTAVAMASLSAGLWGFIAVRRGIPVPQVRKAGDAVALGVPRPELGGRLLGVVPVVQAVHGPPAVGTPAHDGDRTPSLVPRDFVVDHAPEDDGAALLRDGQGGR